VIDKTFHKIFIILGVFLTVFLVIACLFSLSRAYLDINISSHGLFALSLGCFFSFALIGFLTVLLFLSHQKGFDDQVINSPKETKKK
tara:strand:- start:927 stop:1187 length:261 start_codon:yes stop_codon:yes gene_type:complete